MMISPSSRHVCRTYTRGYPPPVPRREASTALKRWSACVVCVALFGASGVSGRTSEPSTHLVSVSSAGLQGNSTSRDPAVSADGRFVAFKSAASNLVPDDTNGLDDVFVRDLQSGTTERVSVDSAGVQGSSGGLGGGIAISADGRYVAFVSTAGLVSDDLNSTADVFVHDRLTRTTERVSVGTNAPGGTGGGGTTLAISADGRFVVFDSAFCGQCLLEVFVHDRTMARTEKVSVSTTGGQPNGSSGFSTISADGRFVAFASVATNLVEGDTNGRFDVFVRDRQSGTTELVSVAHDGDQGSLDSGLGSGFGGFPVSISGDGNFVAFVSSAPNLVADDTNQGHDVFVRDRVSGTTERISVGSAGEQLRLACFGTCVGTAISGDGRFVAFDSFVLPGGNSGDVLLHDRETHTTELVSVTRIDGANFAPAISADGRFVAFHDLVNAHVFVRDRGGVADTEPPALNLPADISVDATSPAGATVTYLASAIDNIDGALTATCSPQSGGVFAVGTTSVTCSATDAAGNTATATFVVTVQPFFSPFARLEAEIEIEPDEVTLKALLHLGATSDGLYPGAEPVTVRVGAFEVTFPAGSFTDDGHGRFRVRADAGEPALDARIRPEGSGFEFRVDLPRHLAATLGASVEVSLTIGNDRGVTTALVDTN